jgi:putative transposase
MMLNVSDPPGFRGLHPDLPIHVYHRHLPHWRQEGATYFVSFRLADALPQNIVRYLRQLRNDWQRKTPHPTNDDWEQIALEITRRTEAWCDRGYGKCWFNNPVWSRELHDRLLHFHNVRYHCGCHVVMPNHCHAILRPFDGFLLEDILQGVKSIVAKRILLAKGLSGPLWQDESFDRIIRDVDHLWRAVQYIGSNPRRAHLPRSLWFRWIDPSWEEAGWRFIDP